MYDFFRLSGVQASEDCTESTWPVLTRGSGGQGGPREGPQITLCGQQEVPH